MLKQARLLTRPTPEGSWGLSGIYLNIRLQRQINATDGWITASSMTSMD